MNEPTSTLRRVDCPECNGEGSVWREVKRTADTWGGITLDDCPDCDGRGSVLVPVGAAVEEAGDDGA